MKVRACQPNLDLFAILSGNAVYESPCSGKESVPTGKVDKSRNQLYNRFCSDVKLCGAVGDFKATRWVLISQPLNAYCLLKRFSK